jgi:hypothetical protein
MSTVEVRERHFSWGLDHPMNEAIVYFVISPERGPEERIYEDGDLQAVGGVHALEVLLERQSYWFVQLGEVRGELSTYGVSFPESEFARLPEPPEHKWRVGRRNPAFRGSELERRVFEAVFEVVEHTLDSWKKLDQDGAIEAYALKELKINRDRLLALISALRIVPKVYEIAEIVIIKFWYDPSWQEPHLPYDDMILAEYSIRIALQIEWSGDEKLVRIEVMPIATC